MSIFPEDHALLVRHDRHPGPIFLAVWTGEMSRAGDCWRLLVLVGGSSRFPKQRKGWQGTLNTAHMMNNRRLMVVDAYNQLNHG